MELETTETLSTPDPLKPYKAYAAAVGALAAQMLTLTVKWDPWLEVTLIILAAAGGAFLKKNPPKTRKGAPKRRNLEDTYPERVRRPGNGLR